MINMREKMAQSFVKKIAASFLIAIFALPFSVSSGFAQTISEKKAGLSEPCDGGDLSEAMLKTLNEINKELESLDQELHSLYSQALELYHRNANPGCYKDLLEKINKVKDRRTEIENSWRQMAVKEHAEGYALWHQPNTTIEQLIVDYGAQDYVYLIPSDIATIPLSVNSNLPIPRASWSEMLELILAENGIGVKQLNPYLRELYLLKIDRSGLKVLTNRRQDLAFLPSNDRIAFMLSPEPSDVRRVWFFLEKFVNPNSVVLQQIGRDILIVASVSEVQELLKVYDFISANRGDKDYKVIALSRVDAQEITKILGAVFGVLTECPGTQEPVPRHVGKPHSPLITETQNIGYGDNGLQVIPLAEVANAVFLIGTREEIRKAERIICEVEAQVGESRGKVVYWYTTKHSNAEELAEVLSKVYYLIVNSQVSLECEGKSNQDSECCPQGNNTTDTNVNVVQPPPPPQLIPPLSPMGVPYGPGFPFVDNFVVNRSPRPLPPVANVDRDNFIVDLKTGSIVMVVETDILPKLKEVIRKFDVPKKMVQIDILLFEKRVNKECDFGLQLLKTGAKASHHNSTATTFNVGPNGKAPSFPMGIFDFFISRNAGNVLPAFDAIYRFLLTQENVHINASPSVLAINQTPATIEIAQEISVNTGTYAVNTTGGVTLENAFARAQYGIIIDITPTIFTQEDYTCFDDSPDYVTLATDITFQTINPSINSRPDVTTRHVVNEVSIPNGQTVILGGLRQRNTRDAEEKIPFLGEIPGVGILFRNTQIHDDTTEMFIFLTPKIIYDPSEDLERIKYIEICRRPGDIPNFLCCLVNAQEWERQRLFQGTITILLGRPPDNCCCPGGEYDGR